MKYAPIAVMLLAVGCGGGTSVTVGGPASPDGPMSVNGRQAGQELYASLCANCHGAEGLGNGPAAEYLFPRPRNFVAASYKLRTTETGHLPTDGDLLRTITQGIPGSSMPSFAFLSDAQKSSLVDVLKTFAVVEVGGQKKNLWDVKGSGQVIPLPKTPPSSPALISRGAQIYNEMKCLSCHGATGRGDGPAAATLKDGDGVWIPPANFAIGLFKGGADVSDVWMRFSTGLNGTPMPSYADQLSEQDRWALAYYVKSLAGGGGKAVVYNSEQTIRATHAASIPLDPNAAAWDAAPAADVALMMMWQRVEAATSMTVKALHNDQHVALLLEWDDATVDGAIVRPQDFSDAAGAMFGLTSPPGHIAMGEKGKPVNLWQWRFSRQLDLARFQDMEQQFPGMMWDDYMYAKGHYPKKTEEWPGHKPIPNGPDNDKTHLPAWASGNSLGNPLPPSAVEDCNAEGFGTLKPQARGDQNVEGRAVHVAGRWKLVLRRSLAGAGQDAKFARGAAVPVAFAAWDGGAGDRDGKKLFSYWHRLVLE